MNALPLLLAAAVMPTSALAQHQGHAGHAPPPPAETRVPDPHADHASPAPPTDPHAGHAAPPAVQADPHQGHDMEAPPQSADPHAGHDMGPAGEAPAPPVGPPPPHARSGPAHAADAVHSPEAMARAREALRAEHGDMRTSRFSIDRLEYSARGGADGYSWEDVQFRYGGDLDKLWIKSEGEGRFGESLEHAEVQALWSRAVSPFFDLQAGLRQDIGRGPDRTHLVLGTQGLAPYWFEFDATAFVSDKGDVTARFEGEYDLRLTQRLILQPRAELELALQDVPELGLGAGLSGAEVGWRLRYEIVPEFAPYVGVQYERAFGDAADFRRAEGEDVGGWSFVAGIRAWF